MEKVKVGVIGCGTISAAYFKGMKPFGILDVVACADLLPERAQARAEEFGISCPCTPEQLLDSPDIDIVLNLTVPAVHAAVNVAAIEAGKHVYCEKPLAVSREDGKKTMDAAKAKKRLVGCAPDTFLGGGQQTCRKLIEDGWIGEPVAATAFMTNRGPESWHPDPAFYYQVGGGPMLDMGPYYLTAMINLMGPIRRVTGSARTTFIERLITSQPKFGTRVKVEVPTHVAGVMDFENGAVGTIITSFDVWGSNLPRIEVYGTDGSLSVPDPNRFDGEIRYRRGGTKEWTVIPHTHSTEVSRGIGVADMAYAIRTGRPHRANGHLAFHVLDVMHSFEDASKAGKHIEIKSQCERPAALPVHLQVGQLD